MKVIPNTPCYISNVNYLCPEVVENPSVSDLSANDGAAKSSASENSCTGNNASSDAVVDLTPKKVQEPDYKSVIKDANLRRRMGRLLKMSVSCALKSIENIPSEDICGVITSTGMGFMKDTITFGNSLFERAEDMLNPSPFMQSTFNTASGYIALIRKIRSYNTTYVQRAAGFESSLVDAVMLLEENKGKCVLVGAFDEVTPEVDEFRKQLSGGEVKYALGEGASSFVLSHTKSDVQFCGIVSGDVVKAASADAVKDDAGKTLAADAVKDAAGKAVSSDAVKDDAGKAVSSDAVKDDTSDVVKDNVASIFGVASENVNVLTCSSFASETGAFMSMLPVILCRLIARNNLPEGYTLIVDDVNADGPAILVNKI